MTIPRVYSRQQPSASHINEMVDAINALAGQVQEMSLASHGPELTWVDLYEVTQEPEWDDDRKEYYVMARPVVERATTPRRMLRKDTVDEQRVYCVTGWRDSAQEADSEPEYAVGTRIFVTLAGSGLAILDRIAAPEFASSDISGSVATGDTISSAAANLVVAAINPGTDNIERSLVGGVGRGLKVNRKGLYRVDWPCSVRGTHAGDPAPYHYTFTITLLKNGVAAGAAEGHWQWQHLPNRHGNGYAAIHRIINVAAADLPCTFTFLVASANTPTPDTFEIVDSNCVIERIGDAQ